MSDLISRKALCEYALNTIDKTVSPNDIMRFPSAEPEQKKGEWIKVGHWGRSYKCNQCGNYLDFDGVNAGRGGCEFLSKLWSEDER